jgi:hypothetical protein
MSLHLFIILLSDDKIFKIFMECFRPVVSSLQSFCLRMVLKCNNGSKKEDFFTTSRAGGHNVGWAPQGQAARPRKTLVANTLYF